MGMTPETQAALAAIAEREGAEIAEAVEGSETTSVATTQEDTPPTPEPAPKAGTAYVVFSVAGNDTLVLTQVGSSEAVNDVKAISDATGSSPTDGAKYVAIPARSLRVRTVKVVSQPKVVVS